jgi:hypothetical protein
MVLAEAVLWSKPEIIDEVGDTAPLRREECGYLEV